MINKPNEGPDGIQSPDEIQSSAEGSEQDGEVSNIRAEKARDSQRTLEGSTLSFPSLCAGVDRDISKLYERGYTPEGLVAIYSLRLAYIRPVDVTFENMIVLLGLSNDEAETSQAIQAIAIELVSLLENGLNDNTRSALEQKLRQFVELPASK